MTWAGRIATWIPFLLLSLIAVQCIAVGVHPGLKTGFGLLSLIYLFPPLLFRIHNAFFPQVPGSSNLSDSTQYCAWWTGHQIQWIYIAFPDLEVVLRVVPGLYSTWLRLWGAQIGKGVYWTPRVEILDRNLIMIGNNVVLGHRVACTSHVIIKKSDGTMILYLSPPNLGERSFIGAGSSIGPGSVVEPGVRLSLLTLLKPNERRSLKNESMETHSDGRKV